MYVPLSPERRENFRRLRGDPTPTRTPTLVLPDSLDGLAPAEAPCDCVVNYQIGPNRVLMVSYDSRGADYEKFETNNAGSGQAETDQMLERMRLAERVAAEKRQRIRILP